MSFLSSTRWVLSGTILLGLRLGLTAAFVFLSGPPGESAPDPGDVTVRRVTVGWRIPPNSDRSATIKLWVDEIGARSRSELYDQDNILQGIEFRNGRTFTRISVVDGEPVSATVQTAPEGGEVAGGVEFDILRPAEIRPGRGAHPDSTVTVDRIRGKATVQTDDGRTILSFDPASGRLEEVRRETALSTGGVSEELTLAIDYDEDDSISVSSNLFETDLPPDLPVQRITEFTAGDVAAYPSFQVFGVGDRFQSYELVSLREELSPALADRRGSRLVQLDYHSPTGSDVTITSLPASFLVGTPRCSEPLVPTPVQPEADQVRLGNAACNLGDEIETDLGTGVLWFERPTIEIQIGNSVVLVHANTADEALVFTNSLFALS